MDTEVERDFVTFVEARADSLLHAAIAITGHRQQAEDLLQTVLTKAVRHWGRIQGRPEAYLRKAMYYQQVSWWRQGAGSREICTDRLIDHATPHCEISQIDLGIALRGALRRLPPRHRAVLVLRYLDDLPDAEIAEILGCRPSTVRSLTARALGRLRALGLRIDDL